MCVGQTLLLQLLHVSDEGRVLREAQEVIQKLATIADSLEKIILKALLRRDAPEHEEILHGELRLLDKHLECVIPRRILLHSQRIARWKVLEHVPVSMAEHLHKRLALSRHQGCNLRHPDEAVHDMTESEARAVAAAPCGDHHHLELLEVNHIVPVVVHCSNHRIHLALQRHHLQSLHDYNQLSWGDGLCLVGVDLLESLPPFRLQLW
mmetsp:Transcript_89620/g.231300  ORF Transcript_89620/g.231300 Transcript_89620/m.231300 type:complete len:208 (+) Transcript_89620:909-1532(+)